MAGPSSVRGQPLRLLGLLLVRRVNRWAPTAPSTRSGARRSRRTRATRCRWSSRGCARPWAPRRSPGAPAATRSARRARGGRCRSLRPLGRRGRGRARPAATPRPRRTRSMARWRCGAARPCTSCAMSPSPWLRSRAWRRCAWPVWEHASRPTSPWAATSRCSASSRRWSPSIRCASPSPPARPGARAAAAAGPRRSRPRESRAARLPTTSGFRLARARRAARRRGGEQALPARREVVCVAADVRFAERSRAARS